MTPSFLRFFAFAAVLTGTLANPMATGAIPTSQLEARAPTVPLNPTSGLHGMALNKLERRLTNAEKMARGLPLNKPHFRRQADRTGRPRARPSARPATANAAGTAGCAPRTGVIHVTGTGLDGYVGNGGNQYGEYGYTTNRSDALSVTVNDCQGAPFDLVSTNAFKAFPYVGGIQGFANNGVDLRAGSFNYAYLGGVTQTAPQDPPQAVANSFTAATGFPESAESAIWSFNGSNLQAQWINADGSSPATTLAYEANEGVFVLLGDVGAFQGEFGNVQPATFAFQS